MWQIIAEIVVAALALVGTLAGSYWSNRKSAALMEYRLQELEKKVDKHNQVIERTFRLEEDVALLKAEDKRLNERVKVLETK